MHFRLNKTPYYIGLYFLIHSHLSFGQAGLTNAGIIHVQEEAILCVKGDVMIKNANSIPGIIENNGRFGIEGNLDNLSAGNAFSNNSYGKVELIGEDQLIQGVSKINFPTLLTNGNHSNKEFFVDASIKDSLLLKDAIIETNDNTITLENTDVNAIQFDVGFISSNSYGGYFERFTNSTNEYIFPVGSTVLSDYRRSVSILPNDNQVSTHKVRLASIDASDELLGPGATGLEGPFPLNQVNGFVEELNSSFYHNIISSNAIVSILYPTYEEFDALYSWKEDKAVWQEIQPSNFDIDSDPNSAQYNTDNTYSEAIILGKNSDELYTQLITPNNDDANDSFYIKEAESYEDDHLEIFNRWGSKIYETRGYNNDWNGEADQGLILVQKEFENGNKVPAGAYFFQYKRDESQKDVLSGYFHVQY
ncbi:MAG: gliding motility-associated C-terminal domain-containing protein [Flavobacteriales bacterium]|nr:gliding motility-associated C-terminal domain-containing protein [Flavobacteriales bacterium]